MSLHQGNHVSSRIHPHANTLHVSRFSTSRSLQDSGPEKRCRALERENLHLRESLFEVQPLIDELLEWRDTQLKRDVGTRYGRLSPQKPLPSYDDTFEHLQQCSDVILRLLTKKSPTLNHNTDIPPENSMKTIDQLQKEWEEEKLLFEQTILHLLDQKEQASNDLRIQSERLALEYERGLERQKTIERLESENTHLRRELEQVLLMKGLGSVSEQSLELPIDLLLPTGKSGSSRSLHVDVPPQNPLPRQHQTHESQKFTPLAQSAISRKKTNNTTP